MSVSLADVDSELGERIAWVIRASQGKFWISYTYRPIDEQWFFWNAMEAAKKKHGSKWKQYAALAAYPGTSKHGRTKNGKPAAEAVDLACLPTDNKLRANLIKEAGLHTPVPGEPWHCELRPGRGPLPTIETTPPAPQEDDDMPKPDDFVAQANCPGGGWWKLKFNGDVWTDQSNPDGSSKAPFYGGMGNVPPEGKQGVNQFWTIEAVGPNREDGYRLIRADGNRFVFDKQWAEGHGV